MLYLHVQPIFMYHIYLASFSYLMLYCFLLIINNLDVQLHISCSSYVIEESKSTLCCSICIATYICIVMHSTCYVYAGPSQYSTGICMCTICSNYVAIAFEHGYSSVGSLVATDFITDVYNITIASIQNVCTIYVCIDMCIAAIQLPTYKGYR